MLSVSCPSVLYGKYQTVEGKQSSSTSSATLLNANLKRISLGQNILPKLKAFLQSISQLINFLHALVNICTTWRGFGARYRDYSILVGYASTTLKETCTRIYSEAPIRLPAELKDQIIGVTCYKSFHKFRTSGARFTKPPKLSFPAMPVRVY